MAAKRAPSGVYAINMTLKSLTLASGRTFEMGCPVYVSVMWLNVSEMLKGRRRSGGKIEIDSKSVSKYRIEATGVALSRNC